jgi:two-component system sensor histidine kinase UhpB
MEQRAIDARIFTNGPPAERPSDHRIFLSTVPAGRAERRVALALMLASVAVFVAVAPFAKQPLPAVWAFIPIYESALVVTDLITAMLLLGQFYSLRARRLVVLASGYLFTAGMTVVHALSFPGLFAPGGLLGAGPQSTAWLYMLWHAGFPLFVIAYTLLPDERAGDTQPTVFARAPGRSILCCAAAVLALVAACTALATANRTGLPDLLVGGRFTSAYRVTVGLVWTTSAAAFAVLSRYGTRTTLDKWLSVVMCAWMIDIALAAVLNHGRFDLGFYVGRVYGLVAAGFVLVVLLTEGGMLYARLAEVARHELQERMRVNELEHLGQLSAGIQAAREEEQKRIARELHDDLGQQLTAIKLDLAMLEAGLRGHASPPGLHAQAQSMRTLIDETVTSVRRIAAGLRPTVLDDLGLVPALEWLAHDFEGRYGIRVHLRLANGERNFSAAASTAVYRIVQEALTNVARHAQATEVRVETSRAGAEWRLEVADNGRGIAPGAPRSERSFGLLGIRERARQLNGTVSIDTSPGEGLCLSVTLPVAALSDDAAA